jgi:hypothetical protein
METVYSLTRSRPRAGYVVFDFIVDRFDARWWRHDFAADGSYESVAPSALEGVHDELAIDSPATYVIELRSAATALESAVSGLLEVAEGAAVAGETTAADRLADQAGRIERERLRILDEVVRTCDAAWDHAIERVEEARVSEPDALPGAIRTVELLWTARQAVRRMLGSERRAA